MLKCQSFYISVCCAHISALPSHISVFHPLPAILSIMCRKFVQSLAWYYANDGSMQAVVHVSPIHLPPSHCHLLDVPEMDGERPGSWLVQSPLLCNQLEVCPDFCRWLRVGLSGLHPWMRIAFCPVQVSCCWLKLVTGARASSPSVVAVQVRSLSSCCLS